MVEQKNHRLMRILADKLSIAIKAAMARRLPYN
jgi:hypothetical protein